ncbi:MAG TPA: hypothetical protein PKI11_04750 [Candidatus Hydrogenedentes bacterium]|nr:hypothetical protein [Candidatus Hydrogenedentota bacterium]
MGKDRFRKQRRTLSPFNVFLHRPGDLTYPISRDLLKSDAYRVLTKTAQALLPEVFAAYFHATAWEKKGEAFSFTWNATSVQVSENGFRACWRQWLRVGFFEVRGEDQPDTPGGATRYRPSARWESYTPTPEERRSLDKFDAMRKQRINRSKKRRREFREKMRHEAR